jgi:putative Holliday junction resolvase
MYICGMGRWMAIDYGLKRVGLAVTDPLKIIATALTTVENKFVLEYIVDYHKKETLEQIVIGDPIHLDGKKSAMNEEVDKFCILLAKSLPTVPIKKIDERYSSKEAMQSLIQSGVKRKDRRQKEALDKVSATLLLQTYMQNPY